MRKFMKILTVSSVLMMVTAGQVYASMNLDTEASVAGISVALNNYYAKSREPEKKLANTIENKTAKKAENTGSVPETAAATQAETKAAKKTSAYENVAVSQVSGYVNIRSDASTGGDVVGKIYNNCAADILETVEGEDGSWYRIKSGNVTGYMKAEYFVTGDEAEALANEVGTEYAEINTTTLRLRSQPNTTSETLTLLAEGAKYTVLGEEDGFVKLAIDTDMVGYVSKDYINTTVEFEQAVSTAEEAAAKAEEERLKKEADEAMKRLQELKKAEEERKKAESAAAATTAAETKAPETTVPETKTPETTAAETKAPETSPASPEENGTIEVNPEGKGDGTVIAPPAAETTAQLVIQMPETKAPETTAPETTKAPETTAAETTASQGPGTAGPGSGELTSATRTAMVAYAKQFLGNPYVYGGTSLTNGADCSGFTMKIYEHFGISTGRTSRDQAAQGREISVSAVQPGDLLFYSSGSVINHVALYIGGGQVIHSSTPATGIVTAPANYRTPCKAVTFLN